jgi:hypothetical protein
MEDMKRFELIGMLALAVALVGGKAPAPPTTEESDSVFKVELEKEDGPAAKKPSQTLASDKQSDPLDILEELDKADLAQK